MVRTDASGLEKRVAGVKNKGDKMGTIINGIIGGVVFLVVALVGMSGVALVTEPAREAEQKSQHEQSVAQWQSQTMEWVRLPGKIPELKQMNLSDCNSDYYGYTCQSKTINLFGVPIQEVKVSLTPDGQYSYRERNSEFALEMIYNIIDRRYCIKKPLIVTTNLSYQDMTRTDLDMDHQRIYSRLMEMCLPIIYQGQDQRLHEQDIKLEWLKLQQE